MVKRTTKRYFAIFSNKYFIFAFSLIIITVLMINSFFYRIGIIYKDKYQQKELFENMEMLKFVMEEKKKCLSGYAIAVSRFRNLLDDLKNNNLLKRRIVNLDSKLNVKGIKVYNDNLEVIYNTGSNFQLKKEDDLTKSIIDVIKEGYNVSLF